MRPLTWLSLLLPGFVLGLSATRPTQSAPDALVGTWTGQVHYAGESKSIMLRIELNQPGSEVLFLDLPDLKFHNLGPIPITRQGEKYKAAGFSFQLASDKSMSGIWSFDGHELPFEVKPGSLPTGLPPVPLSAPVARPVWTFKTTGAIWSSPAIADDSCYFGSNDGWIYALNTRNGKELWRFKTGGRVLGRPTIHNAYLYMLSDDGYLYKLDRRSAKLIWKFDTHGGTVPRDFPSASSAIYDYFASAATVADGTVFIGSADKKLYAIDAASGHEKWNFETQGIVRSTPAVAGELVFIGSHDHHVYAVNAGTGELKWKHDTLKAVVSSPLVVNGTVYIGSRSSDLFAFDAATGKVLWQFFYWSSWIESSARERDGILYIGSSDYQQLFAINAKTGSREWMVNLDGSVWSTPAVTDRNVYVGVVGVANYFIPHHGGFFVVDRATGKIAWGFPMSVVSGSGDYGVASSPVVGHGLVFFGGLDGTFYAFKQTNSRA
jgi:outer membrane protein assembly factor BamB